MTFCTCQVCGAQLQGPRGPIWELVTHNLIEHGRWPVAVQK